MGQNEKLKPAYVTAGGTRYYSQEQLNQFLGLENTIKLKKKTIGYCRVSSHKQKNDLERQIENVRKYMYARGYQFEIISDIGSGINYNKKGKEYVKTKNIIKLEKKIQQVHRKLANIRNNYLHQTTTSIVKTKPYRIVVEDLNVSGMMKNKHLSDSIRKQCFYEFTRQLEYKCKLREIEFIKADRFYPSSKICSNCGHIKKDLKLKDRTYICSECGFVIDRDYNASLNLANYKLA